MDRSTDSRRARNSDSVMTGGRRRPVSRPSRRRCFLASSLVEPLTERTSLLAEPVCRLGRGCRSARARAPRCPAGRPSWERPGRPRPNPGGAYAAAGGHCARGLAFGVARPAVFGIAVAAVVRLSLRRGRFRRGLRPFAGGAAPGGLAAAGARGWPLAFTLPAAAGRVRRRLLARLAVLGLGRAVAGLRRRVLLAVPAAAAARPAPAAPSRAGGVVIVAAAFGVPGAAPRTPAGSRFPSAPAQGERRDPAAPPAAGTPPAAAGTPPRAPPGSAHRRHVRLSCCHLILCRTARSRASGQSPVRLPGARYRGVPLAGGVPRRARTPHGSTLST